MRNVVFVLICCAAVVLEGWTMGSAFAVNSWLAALVALFGFVVPPIGSFWMIYKAIRGENKPLSFVLMACLPYAFLWYYFDRVKTGKCSNFAMRDHSSEV